MVGPKPEEPSRARLLVEIHALRTCVSAQNGHLERMDTNVARLMDIVLIGLPEHDQPSLVELGREYRRFSRDMRRFQWFVGATFFGITLELVFGAVLFYLRGGLTLP